MPKGRVRAFVVVLATLSSPTGEAYAAGSAALRQATRISERDKKDIIL
jgi:hypothetical protein